MIEGLGRIAARRTAMKREQIASEIREILPDGFAVVVEDEQIIRQLAASLLTSQGYRILEASTPAEALKIGREYPEPIRLLLSDVLMPGMRGNELAELLREMRPGLAVLYMSGYSDSTFLSTGALKGAGFLQKPFMAPDLLRAVEEALHSTPRVSTAS